MTVILWDFLTMDFDNVTHTPTHSRSAFTPYSSTFTVFPFFALNLLSPICVAQLLLDVGPGLDVVDWPRVTPLKKNPSSSLRRSVLHAVVLLCLHLRSLTRLLGVHRCALPVVSGKDCVFDIIYTACSSTMILSLGSSVQGWEFHSLLFSACWPVVGLYVYHRLL